MWLQQTLGFVSPFASQASWATAQSFISPILRAGPDGRAPGCLLGGGPWGSRRTRASSFLLPLTDWQEERVSPAGPQRSLPGFFASSSMVPAVVIQTPPGEFVLPTSAPATGELPGAAGSDWVSWWVNLGFPHLDSPIITFTLKEVCNSLVSVGEAHPPCLSVRVHTQSLRPGPGCASHMNSALQFRAA